MGNTDMGRKTAGEVGDDTFGIGQTLATFQRSGNIPLSIQLLIMCIKDKYSATGFLNFA